MRPRRSSFEWLLEAVAITGLVLGLTIVALNWSGLPERIPTHFNSAGEPDGWGGKNSLMYLLAVHVGVFLLMTATSFFPHLINVPFEIDRKSPPVQRVSLRMSIVLKAAIMLLFAWMTWQQVQTALGNAHGLGSYFLPLFLLGVLGPALYYTVQLWRLRTR